MYDRFIGVAYLFGQSNRGTQSCGLWIHSWPRRRGGLGDFPVLAWALIIVRKVTIVIGMTSYAVLQDERRLIVDSVRVLFLGI